MNENFKHHLSSSGMTMYELAAKAGIPYTTVNKLLHDKQDINRISAEALFRISVVLETTVTELMNHVEILDNATGHCGKIKYKWQCNEGQNAYIIFDHKGNQVLLDMEDRFNNVSERKYYDLFARMAIERYMKRSRFEESVEEKMNAKILS